MSRVSMIDGHIDKMTNFERIKSMSVEQLAKLLIDTNNGDFIVNICDCMYCDECNEESVKCSGRCDKAIIKWLESEVETE